MRLSALTVTSFFVDMHVDVIQHDQGGFLQPESIVKVYYTDPLGLEIGDRCGVHGLHYVYFGRMPEVQAFLVLKLVGFGVASQPIAPSRLPLLVDQMNRIDLDFHCHSLRERLNLKLE